MNPRAVYTLKKPYCPFLIPYLNVFSSFFFHLGESHYKFSNWLLYPNLFKSSIFLKCLSFYVLMFRCKYIFLTMLFHHVHVGFTPVKLYILLDCMFLYILWLSYYSISQKFSYCERPTFTMFVASASCFMFCIAWSRKSLLADITFIRLISRVCSFMSRYIAWCNKFLSTSITLIMFSCSMTK